MNSATESFQVRYKDEAQALNKLAGDIANREIVKKPTASFFAKAASLIGELPDEPMQRAARAFFSERVEAWRAF